MSLFPDNPNIGDTVSVGTVTSLDWTWDGTKWILNLTYTANSKLGVANNLSDVANSMVSFNNIKQTANLTYEGVSILPIRECQGRLTLSSGVPVTNTNINAANTIYWTPYKGSRYPWYNGNNWTIRTSTELSLVLDSNGAHTGFHRINKPYDLFLYNDNGTDRLVSGPEWSSNTARANTITILNGIYVNNDLITAKYDNSANTISIPASQGTYVGTAYMSANGATNDDQRLRFVWNMYNRIPRKLYRVDPTSSWNYSVAILRQARSDANNQVEFVRGLDEDVTYLETSALAQSSGATARLVFGGIGLDSNTAIASSDSTSQEDLVTTSVFANLQGEYNGLPGIGYHRLVWLEAGGNADTQTFYGTLSALVQSGMTGWCMS